MRSKMVYRRLLRRCKASRMKKKRVALELAKLKAETNRISELQREVKQDLEQIAFQIAKKREENKLLLEHDARNRCGEVANILQQIKGTQSRLILLSEISQAKEQKDFVKAGELSNSLRELMASPDVEKSDEKDLHR